MKASRFFPYVLLLIVIALFAACGGDDEGDSGTSTAAATNSPAATATAVGTVYPLTVTDMLGRAVTIDAKPKAVAALSPTTVELVYAVGGTSLTRTKSVQYPAAAVSAADIGSSYQPSLELVAAQNPDLIIADSMLQPQLLQDLQALGVPVLYAGVGVWNDVATGLELVGQVLDSSDKAQEAVAALEKTRSDLVAKVPSQKATVLILNGSPDDFYAAKAESYVGNLAGLLGAENPAAGAPDVGQFPGYTKLSLESIAAAAPDVVLAITAGPPGGPTITDTLAADPAWATVPAVQNQRVSEISAELFLQAPGPRVGDALKQLASLIYPEVFGP